jgi:F0F1-type ATP synthase assembly protein I
MIRVSMPAETLAAIIGGSLVAGVLIGVLIGWLAWRRGR